MPSKATWMVAAVNPRKKFLDTRKISSFLWVSSLSYRRPARQIIVSHTTNKTSSNFVNMKLYTVCCISGKVVPYCTQARNRVR